MIMHHFYTTVCESGILHSTMVKSGIVSRHVADAFDAFHHTIPGLSG